MRVATRGLPCAFYCMQSARTRPILGDAEHTSIITRKCSTYPPLLKVKIRALPVLCCMKFWFHHQDWLSNPLSAAYGINNGALYGAREQKAGFDVNCTRSSEGNSTRRRSTANLREREFAGAVATQNAPAQRRRPQSRGASANERLHLIRRRREGHEKGPVLCRRHL